MPALHLSNLRLSYPGLEAPVLDIASLHIPAGSQVAITGPSGSGKSTLLNVITGLARPDQGCVRWDDTDLATLSESRADRWRGAHIGLVMQDFHLFPGLSALDSVLLPARLARAMTPGLQARAQALLARTGLARPAQRIETLSRGEMQRVAVARALVRSPGVLVADEPTASLDMTHGTRIGALLTEMAAEANATLLIVSHDAQLVARLPRRLQLLGGQIASDLEARA